MYIPYLRGNEFELAALTTLSYTQMFKQGKILPIIEPVSTTKKCLPKYRKLVALQSPFILIVNPLVGNLTATGEVNNVLVNGVLQGYDGYNLGYLISKFTQFDELKQFVTANPDRKISLIHYSLPSFSNDIIVYINSLSTIEHNIILADNFNQSYSKSISDSKAKKIILNDGFKKQVNNASYATNPSEFFSNIETEFERKGYNGFGDFCTIGEQYTDSKGARAHAVVIHWTYLKTNNTMIDHFVSDDISPDKDLGGKFGQAYRKLNNLWVTEETAKGTMGSKIMEDQYGKPGKLPQLGKIKQLSIMHHIELMKNILN